jgi:hypothetical protein
MKTAKEALQCAAEIAGRQAADDELAANATTDLDARIICQAQRDRALAIQKAILETCDVTARHNDPDQRPGKQPKT